MPHNPRDIERALQSFRPSVYSTGEQQLQPYTPLWPEGVGYGSWLTSLTQYTPVGYAAKKVGEWTSGGEQEGSIGGTCTDVGGVLGKVGAKVSCANLSDAQSGRPVGTTEQYVPYDDTKAGSLLAAAAWTQDTGGKAIDALVPDFLPDFIPGAGGDDAPDCDAECQAKKKRNAIITAVVATVLGLTSIVIIKRKLAEDDEEE